MIEINNKNLNKEQIEAVEYKDGPLLIIAGAGSGKTRVITYRIANLIGKYNVKPWHILAVTFTNKAAEEMRSRVFELLERDINELMIKTFHSVCLRILRRDSQHIGIDNNFVIVDEVDKKSIVKSIIKDMDLDREIYNPDKIIELIGKWKSYEIEYDIEFRSTFEKISFDIYKEYEKYKERLSGLDFDDLLLKTVKLFKKNRDVLSYYRNKWQYILVDEFQDTNHIQYEFMSLLAREHKNVCVVGDEDQSIYSWRGATVENIFKFQKDFSNAKIIKLEQNYRSTQNILKAASKVISFNKKRSDKVLWSKKGRGELIDIYKFDDTRKESNFVAREIFKLIDSSSYNYRDIAIFYRANYISRSFEMNLREYRIPYVIIGGVKFFERKEVKDILAYLRLINNPNDEISLLRIINVPTRGIGATAIEKLQIYCDKNGMNMYELLLKIDDFKEIKGKAKKGIEDFVNVIEKLKDKRNKYSVSDFTSLIINETGYSEYLKKSPVEEYDMRIGNLSELIEHIKEMESINNSLNIQSFLENISLQTSIDEWDSDDNNLSLMTLHNAKGLEFKVVFIVGMMDGIFPHYKNINEDDYALEEERRLFYVGLTRAKEKVYITLSKERSFFGKPIPSENSRFIDELPDESIKFHNLTTVNSYRNDYKRYYRF